MSWHGNTAFHCLARSEDLRVIMESEFTSNEVLVYEQGINNQLVYL